MKLLHIFIITLTLSLVLSCKKDDDNGNLPSDISEVVLPDSSDSNPIYSGAQVEIQGKGFNKTSSIWINDDETETIDFTESTITFIAPELTGSHNIILKHQGNKSELGVMYFRIYVETIYASELISGSEYTLFKYDDELQKFSQQGFFEPTYGVVGVENTLYYIGNQRLDANKGNSLYQYDLENSRESLLKQSQLISTIGLINYKLHILEYNKSNGYQLFSYADGDFLNGKVIKTFGKPNNIDSYNYEYGIDDDYIFVYDVSSETLFLSGTITDLGNLEYPIITSFSLKSGEINSKIYTEDKYIDNTFSFTVQNTPPSKVLLIRNYTERQTPKTVIEQIDPETLEIKKRIDILNSNLQNPVYQKQNSLLFGHNTQHANTPNERSIASSYNLDTGATQNYDALSNLQTIFVVPSLK